MSDNEEKNMSDNEEKSPKQSPAATQDITTPAAKQDITTPAAKQNITAPAAKGNKTTPAPTSNAISLEKLEIDRSSSKIMSNSKTQVRRRKLFTLKRLGRKVKAIFKKKPKKSDVNEHTTEEESKPPTSSSSSSTIDSDENEKLLLASKNKMETITLYEEFRLVEKPEGEISSAWKGGHLILFFLTFVFGSFCTFCFHVLMYMFDQKCVLSPKMVSIKFGKKNNPTGIIIDYIAAKDYKSIPVEFVTTIWVDQSHCYLPTYVPLISGIFGLIWTTMFLMTASGTQTVSGKQQKCARIFLSRMEDVELQRHWRIVPAVFIFSTIMSILCIYATVDTHTGLMDLCYSLANVFGGETCSFTINVATLTYERRIRGVYQATRLTIFTAWLHTLCWVCAALLALARMLLAVDFHLVRVRADLIGNIELMLERHEKLIRTNEYWADADNPLVKQKSQESIKVQFVNKGFVTDSPTSLNRNTDDSLTNIQERLTGDYSYSDSVDNASIGNKQSPILSPRSIQKPTRIPISYSDSSIVGGNRFQQKSKQTESEKTLTFKLDTQSVEQLSTVKSNGTLKPASSQNEDDEDQSSASTSAKSKTDKKNSTSKPETPQKTPDKDTDSTVTSKPETPQKTLDKDSDSTVTSKPETPQKTPDKDTDSTVTSEPETPQKTPDKDSDSTVTSEPESPQKIEDKETADSTVTKPKKDREKEKQD